MDFPSYFYKSLWKIVKEDAIKLMKEIYAGKVQLDRLNYINVVLIPKKSTAKRIRDYIPISFVNCIVRIVSKVLANRLGLVLKSHIG